MSSVNDKMSASSPTNPADFTLEETLEIIETGMGKNARYIFEQNAQQKQQENKDISNINNRIDRLENILEKLVIVLDKLVPVISHVGVLPEKKNTDIKELPYNSRTEVNKIVRDYCYTHKAYHSDAWNSIYRELSYKTGKDLQRMARETNLSVLDTIENYGYMADLLEIAQFMLK